MYVGEGVVLDSRYDLKVDPLKLPDGLEVGCEKKRRITGDFKVRASFVVGVLWGF